MRTIKSRRIRMAGHLAHIDLVVNEDNILVHILEGKT
jgi:hypothetical protein